MKQDCVLVKTGKRDTAGQEEEMLVCYCGTTACQKIPPKYYPLPKDFSNLSFKVDVRGVPPELDCDCEYEYVLKDGNICAKCEKRYYDALRAGKIK